MMRRPYGRSRGDHYPSYDTGNEFARRHIEAYHQLERELGGTVDDVRQYFFSLSPKELQAILRDYGRRHGDQARDYAERTVRKWQKGQVHMSGLVAGRLFDLLPPRMPLEQKYKLIETLWKHVGPRSKKTLRVGLDASIEQVLEVVRNHMDEVVVHYQIPYDLERRFNWLASGDSRVKQELLNHFQQYEKALIAEGARSQLPVMLSHLKGQAGQYTHRLAQVLTIGNHELELTIDKNASGVAFVEPRILRPSSRPGAPDFKWLWWAVPLAIAILYFLTHHR